MNTTSRATRSPATISEPATSEGDGIDEALIEGLVHGFYAKVRRDPLLGPVFDSRIGDWDTHLARMCRFWSSVALGSGAYQGNPMARHAPLPVDAVHFDRWLALFEETAEEICPPSAAALFIKRARRIAQSLELGIAIHAGKMPARGQRFHRAAPSGQGEQP